LGIEHHRNAIAEATRTVIGRGCAREQKRIK
jgi:hypothetical protein